ncbi:MAG TPA: ACP S-malonyltransferase [Candidatus Ruminococcus avistercoris]|nr:ACP S-malonyltransferase [Candidatus Ruminococcus avistercoris]
MGKIAYIFPGQGAQKAGMGKDFYENCALSREIYEKSSQLLGFSMEELCFEENDRLDITEYTQAALVTTSVAMLAQIEEMGYTPDVTAGLSLGEYCALVSCKAMTFADAVKVVRQRGILMQEAVPLGQGAMAAVLGMTAEQIDQVVDPIDGVEVANYNCPGQIVISGKTDAVQTACQALKEAGAKRTVPLKVSGPFHSSMLAGAGKKLGEVLEPVVLTEHSIPYVTNVTASYVEGTEEIKDLLVRQVSSSVRWQQSVENMIAAGVDRFVEIGPGKTLASFVKKISREVSVYNVNTWESLEGLKEYLGR